MLAIRLFKMESKLWWSYLFCSLFITLIQVSKITFFNINDDFLDKSFLVVFFKITLHGRPRAENFQYNTDDEFVAFNTTFPQKITLISSEFSLMMNSVLQFLKANHKLSQSMLYDDDVTDIKNIKFLQIAYESRNNIQGAYYRIKFYVFGGVEADEF